MSQWETRDAGDGRSFIERYTGDDTQRFLQSPIDYDDAVQVEELLARLAQAEADRDELKAKWEKDNLCGICPYRQKVQAENDRLREAAQYAVDAGVLDALAEVLAGEKQ